MSIEPPRSTGPPLTALRAFEAAARHESFVLAASELNVTPGAIAQQIKHLEAWAGCPLFERHPQGVRLTHRGRSIVPEFSKAFDALGTAVRALRHASAPHELRIAALPSVAQLWLLPRLPKLRAAFPKLTISVTAMETPPNLVREPFDVALFFDVTPAAGTVAQVIAAAERFPVCSPAVARRLKKPEQLAEEVLLHDATWRRDWPDWLEAAGVTSVDGRSGPVFSLYSLALEEARQSAGVLIGCSPLVAESLAKRQLVRPFRHIVTSGTQLCAMTRDTADAASERQVVAWLSRQ